MVTFCQASLASIESVLLVFYVNAKEEKSKIADDTDGQKKVKSHFGLLPIFALNRAVHSESTATAEAAEADAEKTEKEKPDEANGIDRLKANTSSERKALYMDRGMFVVNFIISVGFYTSLIVFWSGLMD